MPWRLHHPPDLTMRCRSALIQMMSEAKSYDERMGIMVRRFPSIISIGIDELMLKLMVEEK